MNEKKKTTTKHHPHPHPHHHGRPDSGDAFIPDPGSGPARTRDDLAEELAEEFLGGATSGEGQGEEGHEQLVEEEEGGPFVTTSGDQEFAGGADASNPIDAERAPFPETGAKR